jgi:hypothetical protein
MRYSNGVPAHEIVDAVWRKSSRSTVEGNCVEVTTLPGGGVAVRNSRDPQGPALVYTRDEVSAFLEGAKGGEFDYLTA